MPEVRPSIPADMEREGLTEAGHRCAVCGEPCPLERAHIVPWRRSKLHQAEDLICLCANCHQRADNERWGEKTLRVYKEKPWVVRSRGESPDRPVRRVVTLRIDFPFDSFGEANKHIWHHALAAFLRIPPEDIRIIAIESGSTLVTIEIPNEAAQKLLQAVRTTDPAYMKLLGMLQPDQGERPPGGQPGISCRGATGKVKWFNDEKGYGFIQADDGGPDVFVHHTSIQMEGFRALADGEPVEFEIAQDPKGPRAVWVRKT